MKYAFLICEMYHDTAAAENARQRYLSVAGGGAPEKVAELAVKECELPLIELLRRAGFAASNGEARRAVQGRGVKIDGETVTDPAMTLKIGEPFVLQFGKNRFVKILQQ